MGNRLIPALATAILLNAVAGAPAAAEEDGQAWAAAVAQGPVRGDLFLWIEAQGRATDNFGGGSQIILRPAIGARIARDAHAIAGYAYIRTDPEGQAVTNEHRLWQQVQFPLLRDGQGRPILISRSRLEQRMLEGGDDTGWRLRQMLRVNVPVARQGSVQAVIWSEGFFNLNQTRWGARDGIDQWRNFVGIGLPIAPGLRIEPGYLNQHVRRPGSDRSNHIASVTLLVAL